MTERRVYPLSIRDVSPGEGAVRLVGTHVNGWTVGMHTGGAWLLGDDVFKPCDGRPGLDADCHEETLEEAVLTEMAGHLMFPKNWEIVEVNGRRFIKRARAYVYGNDIPISHLSQPQLLKMEQGVRGLNAAKWEINDPIVLAQDPNTYQLFVLDMSAAQRMTGSGAYAATDEHRIYDIFKLAGQDKLVTLRRHGRSVIHNVLSFEQRYDEQYAHVYASFSRPVDGSWARFPKDALFFATQGADWPQMIPHTWIVTKQPLDTDTIKSYELQWAWSPIHI